MSTRSIPKKRSNGPLVDQCNRLLQNSLSMVCIGGLDGYLKHINPAISAALGYTEEEMTSLPMIDLVHPDDREIAAEQTERLARGQSIHGAEMRIAAKDGTYRWVMWDAVPSLEDDVFMAIGQDITQRKAVEEELRESQERFHHLARATDQAVWDWDLRTHRVWRNEAFLRTFGQVDDQGQGTIEWWRKHVHPDDIERLLSEIPPPIVDGQQQWRLQYRMRRRDGTYADIYDRGFVVFDPQARPVRMVGSLLDITPLKHAQEELRESEERFRLAAKATRDAIWDWDIRKGRVWRSETIETFFGYPRGADTEDLDWWLERTHPDDRQRVVSIVSQTIEAGREQCSCEYRFRRADGTYADVLERGFVMYDTDGKAVRMVGSLMDVSERRRAQETLLLQQAELAHIARVNTMGEIASGLAHELNQPLATIANYAESCTQALVSRTPPSIDMLLGWIEKIASNTHRAGEIIRRLRTFTRKSAPRRARVALDDLVGDVIGLIEPETRRRNMRLRWQPIEGADVVVDQVQIQQVLVNLLNNAYDAVNGLPPERRSVTIEAARVGDKIRLSVVDAGHGVADDHRDRIFDPFFTTKTSGVGIGLAISRSIVEAHGGRLWLTANPRHGVTLHFTLPTPEAEDD